MKKRIQKKSNKTFLSKKASKNAPSLYEVSLNLKRFVVVDKRLPEQQQDRCARNSIKDIITHLEEIPGFAVNERSISIKKIDQAQVPLEDLTETVTHSENDYVSCASNKDFSIPFVETSFGLYNLYQDVTPNDGWFRLKEVPRKSAIIEEVVACLTNAFNDLKDKGFSFKNSKRSEYLTASKNNVTVSILNPFNKDVIKSLRVTDINVFPDKTKLIDDQVMLGCEKLFCEFVAVNNASITIKTFNSVEDIFSRNSFELSYEPALSDIKRRRIERTCAINILEQGVIA